MAPSPSAAAAAQRLARGCNSHAGGSEHELRPVVCAGKPALTSQCVGDACHAPRLPGCARATAMRGRASQGARSGAGAGGAFGPPITCERGPRTSAQAERARACEHDILSVACAGKPALTVMQCVGDACRAPRLPGARARRHCGAAPRGVREVALAPAGPSDHQLPANRALGRARKPSGRAPVLSSTGDSRHAAQVRTMRASECAAACHRGHHRRAGASCRRPWNRPSTSFCLCPCQRNLYRLSNRPCRRGGDLPFRRACCRRRTRRTDGWTLPLQRRRAPARPGPAAGSACRQTTLLWGAQRTGPPSGCARPTTS